MWFAHLVVYTLARILRTRLDMQGHCSHADLVPQVVGGTEGQHWLPPSTSEGPPGIMNASVAKVVD